MVLGHDSGAGIHYPDRLAGDILLPDLDRREALQPALVIAQDHRILLVGQIAEEERFAGAAVILCVEAEHVCARLRAEIFDPLDAAAELTHRACPDRRRSRRHIRDELLELAIPAHGNILVRKTVALGSSWSVRVYH